MALFYDTKSTVQVVNALTQTYSHTVTTSGASRVLFVEAIAVGDDITGITYAGTPMTLVGTVKQGTDVQLFVYGLVNPATGANNVVVTQSVSGFIVSASKSYYADSTITIGTPTTSTKAVASTTHASSLVVNNGGWAIGFVREDTGSSTFTAGANTTIRIDNVGNGIHSYDSNGATSGTHNFNATYNISVKEAWLNVEIYETISPKRLMMMGVGS